MAKRSYPPYVLSTGRIPRLLERIIEAREPERFNQDFLEQTLGLKGGSARALIPLHKRLGFLNEDGSTSRLYSRFRNPDSRGAAMAEAMRAGYADLFNRNENIHTFDRPKLKSFVVEATGEAKQSRIVDAIVGTFEALSAHADFAATHNEPEMREMPAQTDTAGQTTSIVDETDLEQFARLRTGETGQTFGLNLAYTINLNLPETDDINVFNAIFKSLKENLLTK